MITTEQLAVKLPNMTISQIAFFIRKDWAKVNYAAVPYLSAMCGLESVNDSYGCDDGRGIVIYFLSNAATYRGENAKLIKKELNKRVK